MILYDKGRLLVGVKLIHLAYAALLSFFIFMVMFIYREHYHGFSNLTRVEGGWKAEWSGSWHPWGELETRKCFRKDGSGDWRWLDTGQVTHGGELNRKINAIHSKRLAEEFKGK